MMGHFDPWREFRVSVGGETLVNNVRSHMIFSINKDGVKHLTI